MLSRKRSPRVAEVGVSSSVAVGAVGSGPGDLGPAHASYIRRRRKPRVTTPLSPPRLHPP